MTWFSLNWFTISQFRAFYWADSLFLYGILVVPILFWLRTAFHAQAFQKLTLSFVSDEPVSSFTAWLRWLFPISIFLGFCCLLVALARPQIVNNLTETDAEVIDIVLAVDISESMLETDLKPNRLSAAKSVAKKFVMGRLRDRIGLVIFAGEAFTLCPLTDDYELLQNFIDEINPNNIIVSGTAIGSALAVCINRLRESNAKSKVVILLSDGENTAGNIAPETATKLAKAFGIKVYTVAVGQNSQAKAVTDSLGIVVQSFSDEETLRQIASTTAGQFYRATDNSVLQGIFSKINTLEKVKVKNRKYQEVIDFYRIYLNWAIVFFLFALAFKALFIANVLED